MHIQQLGSQMEHVMTDLYHDFKEDFLEENEVEPPLEFMC